MDGDGLGWGLRIGPPRHFALKWHEKNGSITRVIKIINDFSFIIPQLYIIYRRITTFDKLSIVFVASDIVLALVFDIEWVSSARLEMKEFLLTS